MNACRPQRVLRLLPPHRPHARPQFLLLVPAAFARTEATPCAPSTPSCAIATTSAKAKARRAKRSITGARDLDRALAGEYPRQPALAGFHDTVKRYRIPHQYFHEMIDGVSSDLEPREIQTFDELYHYCYQVASVVGLTIIHIFGFESPEALLLAEKCGIAFQLTNILRDVREDRENGRIYIPAEDIRRFDADLANYDEKFIKPDAFRSRARAPVLRRIASADRDGAPAQPPVAVGADRNLSPAAGEDRAVQFRRAGRTDPRADLGKARHPGQGNS